MLLKERIFDAATRELVASGNFKQALKNVDKRLKKSPKSVVQLTTKATILLEAKDYKPSFETCQLILSQAPLVLETEYIIILNYTLLRLQHKGRLDTFDTVNKLWQNSLASRSDISRKVDLAYDWVTASILNAQWIYLGKAAAFLQRCPAVSETSQRNCWFWGIVANLIASWDSTLRPQIKTVYSELAIKILDKAADLTPAPSKDTQPPGKWIASTNELDLILNARPTSDQLIEFQALLFLKLYSNPAFAPRTKIAANQWYLSKDHYEAMFEHDLHVGLYSATREALHYASTHKYQWLIDDQMTWRFFVMATKGVPGLYDEALAFAKRLVGARQTSRAVRQSIMALLQWKEEEDPTGNFETITASAVDYFETYGDTPCLASDMKRFVKTQAPAVYSNFRKTVGQIAVDRGFKVRESDQLKWLVSEISVLKLDLQSILDRFESETLDASEHKAFRRVLVQFTKTCIRLYGVSRCHSAKLAKTDTYPGDEACVLAAKALEALQTGSSNAQARVQQLCLLEFLLADSEYNSEARHWQMTTLQRTGLGSLAYASLGRLDVKGVLYETQFARFFLHWGSSFPDVKKTKGSAYEKMGEALVFYREAEASISEALEVALEHQNYAQLVQFEALKERLRLSPTRRMLNFERRRIARLAGHAYDAFDDEIDSKVSWGSEPLPRCSDQTLHDLAYTVPVEAIMSYLSWLEVVDRTYELALSPTPPPFSDNATYFQLIRDIQQTATSEEGTMLTLPEICILDTLPLILGIASQIHHQSTGQDLVPLAQALEDLIEAMAWLVAGTFVGIKQINISKSAFPHADHFAHAYLGLEMDRVIYQLGINILAYLKAYHGKSPTQLVSRCKDSVKTLQTVASEHVSRTRAAALSWRGLLISWYEDADVVYHYFDGEDSPGPEIVELMGHQKIKHYIGTFVQSSVEALDGVMAFAKLQ